MYQVPPQPPESVRTLMLPDERVLWTGVPDSSRILQKRDWLLVPFTLLWAGFAVFWEYTALRGGAPVFFALFGIPFVLVGLYMVVGRFLVRARFLRATTYVLTTRRAIVARGRTVTAEDSTAGPSALERSADGTRVTVAYGTGTGSVLARNNAQSMAIWTGGDLSGRLVFENVTDVDGLLAATQQAVAGSR